MDYDAQLKLQASLDGELSEKEARQVANWLAQDKEAVALHAELRATRKAMVGFEISMQLPESREFFWSKIEREIQRQEPAREKTPALASWLAAWQRFLVPAGAVAALLIVVLLGIWQFGRPAGNTAGFETASNDPAAVTYRDYDSGTTLVWLSYPAEDEFAETKEADIIQ
jgi:anti-sigma factor RsiW